MLDVGCRMLVKENVLLKFVKKIVRTKPGDQVKSTLMDLAAQYCVVL